MDEDIVYSALFTDLARDPSFLERLSPTEELVFKQLLLGHNKEKIAQELGRSPKAINVHVLKVRRKAQEHTQDHNFIEDVPIDSSYESSSLPPINETREVPPLSPTEKRVLALLLERKTELQIAETLKRSPNTVQIHVRNIYRKLNVRNRKQLMILYAAGTDITKAAFDAKGSSLSLYFDTSEFTRSEVQQILEHLASVYRDCGGDHLIVEHVDVLDPSFLLAHA